MGPSPSTAPSTPRRTDVRGSDRSRHHAQHRFGSVRVPSISASESVADGSPVGADPNDRVMTSIRPISACAGFPAKRSSGPVGHKVDPALIRAAIRVPAERAPAVRPRFIAWTRGTSFDAVFALTDTLGLGCAARPRRSRSARVPEDVAVMGFDNIDESRYLGPVAVDGRTAVATRSRRSQWTGSSSASARRASLGRRRPSSRRSASFSASSTSFDADEQPFPRG